ncbi:MAG: DoxX family protein [Candidatus Eremiobacteraeota bacterium]|nr:DoxX family protein [Candidatus Eremiobacteraeota bacterium]
MHEVLVTRASSSGATSGRIPKRIVRLDRKFIEFTRRYSMTVLRVALGVVFVWFGALKIFGVSPVADLVAKTAYFLPPKPTVFGMGVLEVLIGIGLLTAFAIRVTMLLFFVQMFATFLTVVTQPHLVFQDSNPLELSVFGEFLAKNLVLIAAGFAIVSSVPKTGENEKHNNS